MARHCMDRPAAWQVAPCRCKRLRPMAHLNSSVKPGSCYQQLHQIQAQASRGQQRHLTCLARTNGARQLERAVCARASSTAAQHWSQHRKTTILAHAVTSAASDGQLTEPGEAQTLEQQLAQLSLHVDTPAGKVVIRCVEEADVTGACVVLTRAFAGTAEEIGLTDAKKYVDNVVSNPGGGALFVARLYPTDSSLLPPNQTSRLIGTVALSLREDTLQQIPTLPPPPNTAYLSNMAVDAKFRRQGVARALMRACDMATQLAGLPEIYLHVRQGDEAAIRLYASSGFQEVARDSFFAARLKNVRPRILMKKPAA